MTKTPDSKMLDIEFYIDAARAHGENSDPDHEVGDLQTFLRVMWPLLPPEKRLVFALDVDVHNTLDGTSVDYQSELAKIL